MAEGISGLGVAIATGGALLIYAGIKDVNPLVALRDVASGRPSGIQAKERGGRIGGVSASTGTGSRTLPASTGGTTTGGAFPQLVTAVSQFRGDRYSQAKRWQTGFSDCSSIVGKGLKSLGIKPPGASTTWDYLAWSSLTRIAEGQAAAGDLVINQSHMATVTGPGTAIGQQSPRSNVRTGTIKDVMTGTGSYGVYRYTGTQGGSAAGRTTPGTAAA